MSTCFVAGIVKGLIEADDRYRHFGSTIGFQSHWSAAKQCGVVSEDRRVTAKGREWYETLNMSELPDCRASFWIFPDSHWTIKHD